MRVVSISDIHGNAVALSATLKAVEAKSPDLILVLGDLAAFGPRPSEVVQQVRNLDNAQVIRGNTDRYLLNLQADDDPMWDLLRWGAERLTGEDVAYLKSLDWTRKVTAEQLSIQLCHADPTCDDGGFHLSKENEFTEKMAATDAPIVVCGHTHRPFTRQMGNQLLVNDGSVGFPYDGVAKPSFAVIDLKGDQVTSVTIERVDYDKTEVSNELLAIGLPMSDAMARRVKTGSQGAVFR